MMYFILLSSLAIIVSAHEHWTVTDELIGEQEHTSFTHGQARHLSVLNHRVLKEANTKLGHPGFEIAYNGQVHEDLVSTMHLKGVKKVQCQSDAVLLYVDASVEEPAWLERTHEGEKGTWFEGRPLSGACAGKRSLHLESRRNEVNEKSQYVKRMLSVDEMLNIEHDEPFYRKVSGKPSEVHRDGNMVILKVPTKKGTMGEMFQGLKLHATYTPKVHNEISDGTAALHYREKGSRKVRKLIVDKIDDIIEFKKNLENLPDCQFTGQVEGNTGGRRLNWFDKLDGKIPGWGDKVVDFLSSAADEIQDMWNNYGQQFLDKLKNVGKGGTAKLDCILKPNVALNYDLRAGRAVNASIPVGGAEWITCENCYAYSMMQAVVDIEFGSLGIPELVDIHTRSASEASAKVKIENPQILKKLDRVWAKLSEEQYIGNIKFNIGPIPVVVDFAAKLFGSVSNTENIEARFSVGVHASSDTKVGAKWTPADNWQKVQEKNVSFTFYKPEWEFKPNGAEINAYIEPDIMIDLWDFAPVVIKPRPYIGAKFGNEGFSGGGGSTTISNNGGRRLRRSRMLFNASNLTCVDKYDARQGFDAAVSVGDIKIPNKDYLGDFAGKTIVGGFDFPEFTLVESQSIEKQCGALCTGCYSDYLVNRRELEAAAAPNSQDCKENPASCGKFNFDWQLTLIVCASLIAIVGLFGAGLYFSQNMQGIGKEGHSELRDDQRSNNGGLQLSVANAGGRKKKQKNVRGNKGGVDRV